MLKHFKQRSFNNAFFIIAVLLLALLNSACSTNTTSAQAISNNDPTILQLKPRTFVLNTNGQPLLKLNGDVCQVRVQASNSPRIIVQVAIRHYQKNSMPAISYSQSSDRNMININEKLPPQADTNSINDSIAISIMVPQHIDLFLSTKVGNLDVSNVNGQVALATSTGDITTVNSQLHTLSSLTANVGNVFFAGTLMPEGTYDMETRVGRIDIAFPEPPSLQINAQTMIGEIHSDFPSLAVNGNIAQGTLGKPPYAHLSLVTRIGSISILS